MRSDIRFVHLPSDVALADPAVMPEPLDFVFIDDAHRLPMPCIDFHYTEARIKVGGWLGLDDCAMPSVRILHDFLASEEEWAARHRVGNTVFFQRMRETAIVSDWQGQKINQPYRNGARRSRIGRLVSRLAATVRSAR